MSRDWLHTQIPERWAKTLERTAFVLALLAIVALGVEFGPEIWNKCRYLFSGYLAGMGYAALATCSVVAWIEFRKRAQRSANRAGTLGGKSAAGVKLAATGPILYTPWFVKVALLAMAAMCLDLLFPQWTRSFFKPASNNLWNRDFDLPWWHPEGMPLLRAYLVGMSSIVGIGVLRAINPCIGEAEWPDERGDVAWWRRDARTPAYILIAMATLTTAVVLSPSILKLSRRLTSSWDGFSETVLGAVLFFGILHVVITFRWAIDLFKAPRGSSRLTGPDLHNPKPPPPAGLWDRDLDHDFTPGSRPAS